MKDPYAAKRREFGARGEIFGKIRQKSNILADFREPRYASLFTNRFTSRPRVTRYVNLRSKVYSISTSGNGEISGGGTDLRSVPEALSGDRLLRLVNPGDYLSGRSLEETASPAGDELSTRRRLEMIVLKVC